MKWSLTKLTTSEQCHAKYKFRYKDHLKSKPGGAAARGIDNHKTVELFVKGEIDGLPPDLDFYQGFFTGLRATDKFPEHRVSLRRDLTVCEWDDPEVWVQAVLDLKVLCSPSIANVYDWKTGKIYDDHDDQKELYALCVFAEHPEVREVRAIHVYLDLGQNREKTFHRDQVPDMWARWRTRVSFLERLDEGGIFVPNPGFMCRYCPFSRSQGGPCRF